MSALQTAVTKLHTRMSQSNQSPQLTPDQLIDLITPPDDRAVLKRAAEIVETRSYWRESSVGLRLAEHAFMADSSGCDKTIFYHKDSKLQEDADPALIEQLRQWAIRQNEIDWDFGRLAKVLTVLDDKCRSPSQVRYIWPSITGLARVAKLQELVEKLDGCREPSHIPAIPIGRPYLHKCATAVAVACFLEDEDPNEVRDRNKQFVRFNLLGASQNRDEGFGPFGPK